MVPSSSDLQERDRSDIFHIFGPVKAMINYKIINDKQLLVMCFEGDITPEEVISFIDKLVKLPGYDPEFSSIVDLRNCNLVYGVGDMKRTLAYMAGAEGFVAKRRTAYITSSAGHVVPPMMMNTASYDFPMEVKVHSTVDSAIAWLNIPDFTAEDYSNVLRSICD